MPPRPVDTWQRDPTVLAASVDGARDAEVAAQWLASHGGGLFYIGVVAAMDVEWLDVVLGSSLRTHLAEVIFTAPSAAATLDGADAAMRALDHHAVGQDFVFTVPALEDALRCAVDELADSAGRWDGAAVLVVGAQATLAALRDR